MSINKLGGPGGVDRNDPLGAGGQAATRRTDASSTRLEDRVELSSAAKTAIRLADLARGLPEVREARVAELRERVDRGEYRVDARQLARAILDFEGDLER